MPKAAKDDAGEYRSIFGYGNKSSSELAAQVQAADDLAGGYGLADPKALLRWLNYLFGEWQNGLIMFQLDDKARLEVGRLKIHDKVSQLIRTLEENDLSYSRLEKRLHGEHGLNLDTVDSMLRSLQNSSAHTPDDGSPSVFTSKRHDGDARRGWLIFQLACLYETQTKQVAHAYVDDGERTGNIGSDFIVATFLLLTGEKIPKSAVVRVLRDQRKLNDDPKRLA